VLVLKPRGLLQPSGEASPGRFRLELDSALSLLRELAAAQPAPNLVNGAPCVELRPPMVDNLLAVTDCTRTSLEVRVPSLDPSLVEFIADGPRSSVVR